MRKLLFLLLLPLSVFSQTALSPKELARCKATAQRVTIIRDTWGIPHIYGKSDADAVFGLLYAQCEENFQRVEENNLEMMGRLAEAHGMNALYDDLAMRLIYDSKAAIKDYENSPAWLKKLLDAAADGVNYYLYTHPSTKPAVLKHFEPWFALMRTDGSISATQTGGASIQEIKSFYQPGSAPVSYRQPLETDDNISLSGSNGFAIAPSKTASKHAMLYINPHVTFYFRTEAQMVSDEGLNAYGAVTWGTFFIYQGFNAHCGWMHTSSASDVADLYKEKIVHHGDSLLYEYDHQLKPVTTKTIRLNYTDNNQLKPVAITAYYTHHGPVVAKRNGDWISLRENNRSMNALIQSWLRTKAKSFAEFKKVMDLRSNNSNNTVYADAEGNIAYWHGNFMPRRDPSYNWNKPVDGSIAATEWKGIHALDEIVHLYNPASGWIENCNSTPFTASGSSSPDRNKYPKYMAPDGENFRGVNAARLLGNANNITMESLMTLGYDHYLSAFDVLLPPLIKAYDELSAGDSLKAILKEPVQILQSWDRRSSVSSVATTLATEWAKKITRRLADIEEERNQPTLYQIQVTRTPPVEMLRHLADVINDLSKMYGNWRIPWGDINRFQRNTGLMAETFDDTKKSFPSGLTSSRWGSLPAFESRLFPGTKLMYGTSGNSFIAAVEFGEKVKAKTIITGGQSPNPASPHFTDQAEMYLEGKFKDIWFYKEDVMQHVEKKYHPGE